MRTPTKELKVGSLVTMQTFMVTDLKELTTKAGKAYANFTAGDKTGSIAAVWWDYGLAELNITNLLKSGGLVELGGEITEYNGKLQFKITGVGFPTSTDTSLFEKKSKYDESEMWTMFESYVENFDSPLVGRLAHKIAHKYAEQFITKPAATGMHHAFKHGLLEHTLEMLQTADKLFELHFYADSLNKDYCMFGIMFHDFMKIFEYGDGPDFKRTRLGIMVPHIPKMAAIIEAEGREIGLSEELVTYLQSIILSHHRMLEWGSPCKPATPEALFVHYVDNLHGDVFGVLQRMEADTSSEETVKHGFGSDAYTIVKKRFSDVIKETEDDDAKLTGGATRSDDSLVGF